MDEKVISNVSDLTPIADALRSTTGSTQTYSVPELAAAAVNAITSTSKYKQPDWGSEEIRNNIIVEEQNVEFSNGMGEIEGVLGELLVGGTVKVTFDGVLYEFVVTQEHADTGLIGNMGIAGGEDTGEPFLFRSAPWDASHIMIGVKDSVPNHTVGIVADTVIYHEIPVIYTNDFYVTADSSGVTDVSQPEVKEALDAGKAVFLKAPNPRTELQTIILPLTMCSDSEAGFGGIVCSTGFIDQLAYAFINNQVKIKYNNQIGTYS